jgi:Gpi18-like mannosyltransferase
VSNSVADVTFIVLFLLFGVLFLLAAVFLLTRFVYVQQGAEKKNLNYGGLLLAILGIALVVRLIFAFLTKGYRAEYDMIAGLLPRFGKDSLAVIYSRGGLYPVSVYLYSLFGFIAGGAELGADSAAMPLLVKLPFIICDLLTVLIIYKAAQKYVNKYVALILAGFTALFPVFIFASSVWGSTFSVSTLIIVALFYFISTKNYPAVFGVYALALLTSFDAVYLFPVVAVYVIYNYVKCVREFNQDRPADFTALMKDKEKRNVVLFPAYFLLSYILMYIAVLPLFVGTTSNFFKWAYILFFQPLGKLTSFGYNALNIFNLFGRNGADLVATFPSAIFSVLFGIIETMLVLLVYLSRKNRANLSFLGAFVVLTLSIFFMGFGALNLAPVLGLLILSFILIKDKRILQVIGILGFAVVLNAGAAMAAGGELNNLSAFDLSSANTLFTGSTLLSAGGALAVSVISSCITILAFVYATVILLDFSMANKRKLFKPLESPGFFESVKNWIV